MVLTFEKKLFIVIISSSLLTLAILFGLVFPSMRQIDQISTDTYHLRESLEAKENRVLRALSTRQVLETAKRDESSLSDRLFVAGEELDLVKSLENFATTNSVTTKIINSNIDVSSKQYLLLSISAAGSYHNLLAYLSDIESTNTFLNVRHLQFTSSANPLQPTIQATLTLDLAIYVVH